MRVVDRLDRLRHDRIVRGHNQHHDIRHLRATCPHRRKGRVARCIEEGHLHAALIDLIGTDMLGNAAGLA